MKAATALIDRQALKHNMEIVRAYTPNSKVWAIVKANAYGHGLLPIAKALAKQKQDQEKHSEKHQDDQQNNHYADGFGVARYEEALVLRKGGITAPILLLEGFFSPDVLPSLIEHDLQTVVHTIEQLEAIEKAQLEQPLTVWLKIDTGMHRLGVQPEMVPEFIQRLEACKNVKQPIHFVSHFGCADEVDNPITFQQIELFTQLVGEQKGDKSLAASSGCLLWRESHFDAVRPGITLYGVSPVNEKIGADFGLKPVMTMTSSLIAVRTIKKGEAIGYGQRWRADRDTQIGVVAMGYGDGYPRTAPNGTPVFVNGRIVPLAGCVSMDMLTVDLGADANDQVGDEVILWGDVLPVEKVAQHIGTIGYELVTNITSRVALIYQ